jgi:hypothetical protein
MQDMTNKETKKAKNKNDRNLRSQFRKKEEKKKPGDEKEEI